MLKLIGMFALGWGVSMSAMSAPWLFTLKDVTSLHYAAPTAKIAYGVEPEEFGLLRVPEGEGPFPVAIVIHGGCWKSSVGNIMNTESISDALRQAGIATWSIEYRSDDQAGGGFPGTFLDVATATDFLKKIAPKYHLDLKRVIVIGHSAGGQLALWVAARKKIAAKSKIYLPHPLPVLGVISLGGVADLKAARVRAEKVCGGDVIGKLVGEASAARYAETSPGDMLPLTVPQVLISGEKDEVVPTELAKFYLDKARAAGDNAKLIQVPDAGHMEYIVPNSVVWPMLIKEAKGLLGEVKQ